MNKQPELTEQTKQKFMNSFCDLYSRKSIEKISIQEIATKAGYNRSTFYQYFTDIYDLLDVVENSLLNEVQASLATKHDSNTEIRDALQCMESEEHFTALKALLGVYGSGHFLERLKKEISFDKLNFPFHENAALSPYLVEFYLATALSLFRLWLQRGKDLPSEEVFALMDNLYKSGVKPYLAE
ncbi:TetR/AcrR family transcriptional regulator [Enterococcus pingfangensis]|uniref:TetR/AcrR family transcriptional regulator n=1 Tax=Enterococcus pingfangensis TaxID=2559924 RepID=UPI0010FA40C8|nr:TetR/AcrR family transcriptional regulator [Enterococcus pingfangensis]